MDREVLYGKLPYLIRRLFTWGLLSATVFLVIWYSGGAFVWGHFLAFLLKPFAFLMDIHFDGTTFVYTVPLSMSQSSELAFPINQLNLSFVEVVTLFALWPREKAKETWQLAGWCLVWLVAYHLFDLIVQLYRIQIGPDFANRQRVFWEPTWWYTLVAHVAAFDKFILRFWGGFPVFGLALVSRYALAQLMSSRAKGKKAKKKAKKSGRKR